jgi:hypothetical protein
MSVGTVAGVQVASPQARAKGLSSVDSVLIRPHLPFSLQLDGRRNNRVDA